MPEALANPADRLMTIRGLIARFTQQENLNFLLTNRIPRAALTRFMGWFSKIENPLVRDASIACWRLFSDLDLSEAKKTEFKSLHDCFTRELRPGLRPTDPDPAIVVGKQSGQGGDSRHDPRGDATQRGVLTGSREQPAGTGPDFTVVGRQANGGKRTLCFFA